MQPPLWRWFLFMVKRGKIYIEVIIMKAVKIKDGIYWVGAIDWSLRYFHGYTTNRGATYNAYLIIDEKITLIDTAKKPFADELIARISDIIDPAKIDYLVSNHVEMDHSGAIPEVMRLCPDATVVTSSPNGIKGLTMHYGEYKYMTVKAGDSLNIGKRNLNFVPTPMLHWPDNMVTYCPEERILFSNDAFGQHYASSARFDDETPLTEVMEEAKKYYANIVMPYSKQAAGATELVSTLDIDVIAPSHGVVWRGHIDEILAAYRKWSGNVPQNEALVVFDSMWKSTELIARVIAEAFAQKGTAVRYYDLKTTHISDIVPNVLDAKYIAVGSPTLNSGMLPTVAAFLSYLKGLSPKGRLAFAFGSYGWSGQSVGMVEEELKKCGFDICCEMMRIQYIPTGEQLAEVAERIKAL